VYLPEGSWIDYWTGERYAGSQTLDYVLPENAGGPLFIREGAILPYWPEMDYVGQIKPECLELHIYPYRISESLLYEDDGVTLDYLDGQVAKTHFRCEVDERLIRIEISPRSGYYTGMPRLRSYDLVVHSGSRPANIRLNGQPLPEQKNRPRSIKTAGWRYNRQAGRVHLYLEESAFGESAHTLRIELLHSRTAARHAMPAPAPSAPTAVPDYPEEMERDTSAAIALHLGLVHGDPATLDSALAIWWEGKQHVESASPGQWRIDLLHGAQLAIRHVERRGWQVQEVLGAEMEALFALRSLQSPAQGLQLLQRLFRQCVRIAQKSALPAQHPAIRKTIAFADQHIAEKFSLNDAAEQANVHPAHLSRLFKKEMGQTFSDYMMRQRMELAKDLLEFGLNIRDTAALSGFQDVSYFMKCFDSCWGLSPTSF
ncbi:MAG: xylS, partial [Paenibacillus sp.]|nr:xylS [Paenibacillus sp.]